MSAAVKTKMQIHGVNHAVDDDFTDVHNSRRFGRKFAGKLAYIPARGKWMEFVSHGWETDTLGRAVQRAVAVTEDLMLEAATLSIAAARAMDKKEQTALMAQAQETLAWARKSQERRRIESMLSLAQSDPRMALDQAQLDANDMALGLQNGVLELGPVAKFREGQPGDYITRKSGAGWSGGYEDITCPAWETFLQQIQPDPEVRHWLQKFIGYSLTGKTSEQIFVVMHGTGANGKSVLVEVLKRLLGTYSQTVQFSTFVERDQNAIRNDLAMLDKVRLVIASEGQEGVRLDEGMVKQATGEDSISARFLHREFFEYKPRFKVVLVTNHKPVITGTDHGIWRRVVLVPFPITFSKDKQDKRLIDKLENELPGILAWAIKGFHLWQEQGLSDLPKAISSATSDYRQNSDVLGMWLDDYCQIEETSKAASWFTSTSSLYLSYSHWADDMGHRPMSSKSLGDRLRERGLNPGKRGGVRGWWGIRLITPAG